MTFTMESFIQKERNSSKESMISDSDIIDSIRSGNGNKRRDFHKVLFAFAVSAVFILTSSILVNYTGLMYASEINNQVDKLAEVGQEILKYKETKFYKATKRGKYRIKVTSIHLAQR